MVFPEDSGPLAGHVWTLILGQPGGSYNNSWGEPVPALQPLELKPEKERQAGRTEISVLFPEALAS